MHQFPGRGGISKKMGNLLPRRLSRARSALTAGELVIGVSVEQATVEASEGADVKITTVHGPNCPRRSSSLAQLLSPQTGKHWVAKAKGLTQKIRRRMRRKTE